MLGEGDDLRLPYWGPGHFSTILPTVGFNDSTWHWEAKLSHERKGSHSSHLKWFFKSFPSLKCGWKQIMLWNPAPWSSNMGQSMIILDNQTATIDLKKNYVGRIPPSIPVPHLKGEICKNLCFLCCKASNQKPTLASDWEIPGRVTFQHFDKTICKYNVISCLLRILTHDFFLLFFFHGWFLLIEPQVLFKTAGLLKSLNKNTHLPTSSNYIYHKSKSMSHLPTFF